MGARFAVLPPKILVVDDQFVARITIRELLDWHGFDVCGDAKDGKEAIEMVSDVKPDIVLMDINMPGMNGIAAAAEIRQTWPETRIVFLTVHDTPAMMIGTRLWAHGFVSKSDAGTKLIPLLRRLTGLPPEDPPGFKRPAIV